MSALQNNAPSNQPCCPCCGAEVSPLDLIVDIEKGIILYDGAEAHLTPAEMKLFQVLLKAFPAFAAKEIIYEEVYVRDDPNDSPEPKILDVHICKIRRKLKPLGLLIGTAWGIGYNLALDDKTASAVERSKRFALSGRARTKPADASDVMMISLFRAQGWPLTDVARRLKLTFREVASVFDQLDIEEREKRERVFALGAARKDFASADDGREGGR